MRSLLLLEGVMCCCITRETRAAGSQTKVRTRQSPRRTSVSSASSGLGDPPPPHIFVILLFSAPSFCAVLTWLYVLNAGECIVGLTCLTLGIPGGCWTNGGGPGGPRVLGWFSKTLAHQATAAPAASWEPGPRVPTTAPIPQG